MGQLDGRRAVVTGGGRGIGRAACELLAAEGASVVVAARSEDEIAAVAASIVAAGGVAHPMVVDVADDDAVASLAATAPDLLGGPVDVLVNNAAAYLMNPFMDYSLDDWSWMLDVNVLGVVRVTRAFLPAMLELDDTRIVNVASIAGKKATLWQSAYNTTKHALIGITRCLAVEMGAAGVRVNSVCPGFIDTGLVSTERMAELNQMPIEEVWPAINNGTALKRTATVEEVAAAITYLASPLAAGVTGQSLVVDGGMHYS
ncbi:MAG: SDR family oxidoreductase [Actinomycetia bacterium]|nr:SDR family oxidoreductase [Actinomycetes bacterium]